MSLISAAISRRADRVIAVSIFRRKQPYHRASILARATRTSGDVSLELDHVFFNVALALLVPGLGVAASLRGRSPRRIAAP